MALVNTNTDLTFFTNEPGQSLLGRFKATLKDTKFFDVLVGYFRASGFYQLYESLEDVEKIRIYFELLNTNKAKFQLDTTDGQEPDKKSGGKSNTSFIDRILKDKLFKNFKKFTDSDEEFINDVKQLIADGALAKKTAQIIKKAIEKSVADQGLLDPMKVLHILQNNIRSTTIENQQSGNGYQKREVILSGYLIK